jgi:hypothetical protein
MNRSRRIDHTAVRPRRPGSGPGPTARRRAVHASEPAPGDFDAVGHNTAVLLEQVGQLDSALHVEWEISRFLLCWGEAPNGFDVDYVESTTHLIVDELVLTNSTSALLVLRGLEALASRRIAERARDAAELVAAGRVFVPSWAEQIGQARAVDARSTGVSEDGSSGVLIEYAYPDGARHVLAAFIAGDMGGAVKFMGLAKSFAEADPGSDEGLLATNAGVAQSALREALEATDQVHAHLYGDPSMTEFGALAWSRVSA